MKRVYILTLIILITSQYTFGLPQKTSLNFKTTSGHIVKVIEGRITYDNKSIFKIKYASDVLYDSKSDRLIEDHGSIFLFIAMASNPNLDRLNVYLVNPTKATLVTDAILSPIKDYDGDGYLEFGGSDLTEGYPNPDSMYYIPSAYYEIRNGKIHPDLSLTKHKDIQTNGLYLPPNKQLDNEGTCCKVINKPVRKHKTPAKSPGLIPGSFMASDTITVFATKYILTDKDKITNAVHMYDGTWEFYSNGRTYTPKTAEKKVKLAVIIKLDKSILLLSRLPKGSVATRTSKNAPWTFNKLYGKD